MAAASSTKALFYVATAACHWLSGHVQDFCIQWWQCHLSVVSCHLYLRI